MPVAADPGTGPGDHQAIVFRVAGELFGLEIQFVHEIVRFQALTPVPGSGSEVVGLMNLRSRIVPVISLSEILGLPEVEPEPATRIVITSGDDSRVGLLVDEVFEVRTLAGESIQEPPVALRQEAGQVVGIAQTERGLVILLDVEAVVGRLAVHRAG